jgi:hypothetical protein
LGRAPASPQLGSAIKEALGVDVVVVVVVVVVVGVESCLFNEHPEPFREGEPVRACRTCVC